MRVLVLNPGSSTLKAALVTNGQRDAAHALASWPPGADDAETAADAVRRALADLPGSPEAVGYRVVHGGVEYRRASRVDETLLRTVERLDALAPLHNRRAAAVMRTGLAQLPDVPHVACFDTAFHAGLPHVAWRYPLPADWIERWGIRRFGFHGLSVAWAVGRAGEFLGRDPSLLRVVVAHLGSGCSVTAVNGGRSVDTSMGFTPFEGLMMGTRSGSVDPGILLHLLDEGITAEELAEGLTRRSGLLGVSGITASARDLEAAAADGDERARLALELFAARTAAGIAAVATSLPVLDALIFTGGIGQHSAWVRADVVRRLSVLGVPEQLETPGTDGIAAMGPPAVLVIEAREDLVVAAEVADLLAA